MDATSEVTRLRDLLEERDTALALAADCFLSIHEHASSPAKVREYVSDGLEAIEDVTPLRTASEPDGGSGGNVVDFRPRTGGDGPAAA